MYHNIVNVTQTLKFKSFFSTVYTRCTKSPVGVVSFPLKSVETISHTENTFITLHFQGESHFIIASPRLHRLSVPPASPSTILSFLSAILSPSHLRCSGYEKQFPVCRFPWRPVEDHNAGVRLAVRRREICNTRTVCETRSSP